MNTITIIIHTDNAAFDDSDYDGDGLDCGHEVARILRTMADQYEHDGVATSPIDLNGNVIGSVQTFPTTETPS